VKCAAKNCNSKFEQAVSFLPGILAAAWQLVTQPLAENKLPKK